MITTGTRVIATGIGRARDLRQLLSLAVETARFGGQVVLRTHLAAVQVGTVDGTMGGVGRA